MAGNSALVLLSGGQDSATCLSLACRAHESVMAIAFDYGQRHRIELEKAKKLSSLAGCPLRVIDSTFISQLSDNALTSDTLPITTEPGQLPSTFVPGRNLFFLSMAAVIARQHKIDTIYTGVCQTDFSGYPDCRDDFIKSAEQTINLAMDTRLSIKTPLMHLTKSETVLLMKAQGTLSWYAHTHTCYKGQVPACGQCPACQLRLNGFREANINDPLPYI